MGAFYKNLKKFIGSPLFFILTVLLFVFQASWIAISARFPMAFDEAYHLGLIQLHAKQWSPIFLHQPSGPATYGALTRDPSYLYHWLMSLVYRPLSSGGASFMTQIVVMRLINVGLFTVGLVLFWLVLRKTKASESIINLTMLFFTLIPVVTLLAAHLNYDNLLVPCVAGSMLITLHIREQLLEKKRLNIALITWLFVLCCLSSLVKYPFLPIFAGIIVYLSLLFWKVSHRRYPVKLVTAWRKDWQKLASWNKVVLGVAALGALALFTWTYGINLVMYQNPIPQCGEVLNNVTCQAYGPWARNFHAALTKTGGASILYFVPNWIWGMFERLLFVINGPGGPANYENYLAPILAAVAAIGGLGGLGIFTWNSRKILQRDRALAALLFIITFYIVALWGRNYHDYLHLGRMVAINGRYFVPIILPMILACALGGQHFLGDRMRLKFAMLVASAILVLQGGGLISFIVYSNSYWYWPQSPTAQHLNKDAQKIFKPIVWAPKIR